MDLKKDCLSQCKDLMKIHLSGMILKIINKNNPWGDNAMFNLDHLKGIYKIHYVIEDESKIFDPFLEDPIPKSEYLKRVYKNHNELKFSEL